METPEETSNDMQRLMGAFDNAKRYGIAYTQRDFAAALGVNEATLSRALKGDPRYLTKNLISKALDITTPPDDRPTTEHASTELDVKLLKEKVTNLEARLKESEERCAQYWELIKSLTSTCGVNVSQNNTCK